MAYDSNLNWARVIIRQPEEVTRVHGAIRDGLIRPHLRAPIENVVVVQFGDIHADDGVELVREVLEQELGDVDWVDIEVGVGNVLWIYGEE